MFSAGAGRHVDKSSPSTEFFWARVQIAILRDSILVIRERRRVVVDATFSIQR